KVTTLNYSDADGTSKTATFPVPGVKVKLPAPTTGSLIITKAFIGLPDGTTPDSVSFTVTGINYSETVTLSANDQWSKKIDNLTPGTYTVTETSATVPGYTYTTTGTGNATVEAGKDTPVTVTNTYVPATISVTVTKEWNHNGVPADMQPKSVEVNLMNGDTVAATEKLNAGNSWTHTFENLPVKDADGNDITYTVQEKDVPDGYSAAVTGSAANGFTITNTAAWADDDKVNPASLTITKVDGEDDTKLSGAEFTLTKQDDPTADAADTSLTETTGEDGTCTFTGLTEGVYTLEETTAPDGYKQTSKTWTIVVEKNAEPTEIVLTTDKTKFQKVYDCTVSELVENEDKGEDEYAP
ncbi:MAG: Cna B-type domain-containing protein, partial [bacterium]|nr:Cna B-type domain-containing protein [bacterium]